MACAWGLPTRWSRVSEISRAWTFCQLQQCLNVPLYAPPSETASRLGVRFVVHGGVQLSKGLLRLSMEMFDTRTESACFTRKRDLDLSRLPDLEDEIAKQIAVALSANETPINLNLENR